MLGFPLPSIGFPTFKCLPFGAPFRLCSGGFKIEGFGGVRALTSKKPRRGVSYKGCSGFGFGFRGFGIGDSGWVCCVCVCVIIIIITIIIISFLWGGGG